MTSTTARIPTLTGPQIDALLDVARHGRSDRLHPARREALTSRGLIEHTDRALRLTDAGRAALDHYTGTAV